MTSPPENPRDSCLVRLACPLGELGLLLHDGRLARIELPGLGAGRLPVPPGTLILRSPPPALAEAVAAWFQGQERLLAAFPRELAGSAFQMRVWAATQGIPRGGLRTYKEISLAVGLGSGGARAVGGALRANPLPLVVPCHRVVGTGLRLTGFAGGSRAGLDLKRRLLELEGATCASGCSRSS